MGKTIIKILAIISIIALYSCKDTKTPKEFLYHSNINRPVYQSDSLYLYNMITLLISHNIRPFNHVKLFDKKSILNIDTIFYSPNADKMVVFAIVQTDLRKYDDRITDTLKKKYGGFFFFGYRNNKQNFIMNHLCTFLFDADTKEDLKELFYSYTLERKSTDRPYDGEQQYNLNDIRLWSSTQVKFEFKDSTHLVELIDDSLHFLKKLE